jgi:cytochrome c553
MRGSACGGANGLKCKLRDLDAETSAAATWRGSDRTNCIACHGRDPNRAGALGPAIAGSLRALIEARLLGRSYPAGYQPKRHSHLMQPMPWMAAHTDDLTAYPAGAGKDTSPTDRQK